MKLSLLNEAAIKYYKWIYSNEPTIHGIPGFAFASLSDAQKYAKDFDDWCHGPGQKHLYTFTGVKPQPFPIMFGGELAYTKERMPPALTDAEAKAALEYFAKLPEDFFINGRGSSYPPEQRAATAAERNLFYALAATLGCLKPNLRKTYGYVYDVEVYYALPVDMTIVQ